MAELKLPPFTVQETLNPNEIPWGVKHINAPQFWEHSKGKEVIVAVLDTGADKNHSDLAGQILDGRNFTTDYDGDATNFHDNQGHGTHCAGTIAGIINNDGVIGVAPEVKLIIGKVLAGNGSGSYEGIIAGVKWATNWKGPNGEKVRVISMSLGGPEDVPQLHRAIKEAINAGISVVCAAGNEGDGNHFTNELAYPGSYEEVIEVGAIDNNNEVARFSNTNNRIDVVAPGVDIVSTMPNGQWAKMSGTSMATPHVAGALALIISAYEKEGTKLTEKEIYELLLKHTKTLPHSQNAVGKGVVDLTVEVPAQPEPTPSKPAEPFMARVVEKDGKFYIELGAFDTEIEAEKHLTNKLL